MVKIIPLTKELLKKTIRVVDSVFYYEDELPNIAFKASIDAVVFKKYIKENKNIKQLEYFIAVNNKDEVLGTTGLYTEYSDDRDTCWLGWYSVDKKHRCQGIGKKLLKYSITLAKKRSKKYIDVYTSTHPEEKVAQIVYEKYGFLKTNRKHIKESDCEIFFRRKKL